MVYVMNFYVDGGCRGNGQPGSIGAAALVRMLKFGSHACWTKHLPRLPTPTNQCAEITAIIMALEQALQIYHSLDTNPYIDVTIHSDSRYAIGCMTDWIHKWKSNGWLTAAGYEVANRDLIQKASLLLDAVKEEGDVTFAWIPRGENQLADQYANEAMDEQL